MGKSELPPHAALGYARGSSADIVGRLLAAKVSDAWKQPVVVENRAGAASSRRPGSASNDLARFLPRRNIGWQGGVFQC